MLGLDQEVERGQTAVHGVVGEDDRLRRAGRQADIDHVGQQPLGGDDPRAPRPDDLQRRLTVSVP